MATAEAVAIKQEEATRALNETMGRIDGRLASHASHLESLHQRLARIEEATKPREIAPAPPVAGPDVAAIVKAAKEEILAAMTEKAKATGPAVVEAPAPETKTKGK